MRAGADQFAGCGYQGAPPYRIRWDDGTESLYCPGPDAGVRATSSAARGA